MAHASDAEKTLIDELAERHSISVDAIRTVLGALRRGGGRMAQFSHADFGGMSQWSPGMTMVGAMFDDALKAKLDAVCTELAAHLATSPSPDPSTQDVSYRAAKADRWWPDDLGAAGSAGTQGDMAYAVFPAMRRLAIRDGGKVTVYDTGAHDIHGVAQAQSSDQTLTFTSQDGLVRVSDLEMILGKRHDEK